MRRLVILLPLSLGVSNMACGAASSADEAAISTDEELRAKPPIPYLLQHVGRYEGTGPVRSIVLKRGGTYTANVNGHLETGRFAGPNTPKEPLRVAFFTAGDSMSGIVSTKWTASPAHDEIQLTRQGVTEILVGTFAPGGEGMCDDSGGHWTDDDADPATGLFCVCDAPRVFIPSAGGCVR